MNRAAPWICVILHVLALAVLGLFLRDGTELETDVARRAEFIAANVGVWRTGWATWMLSAMSLVGFYAWWAQRLPASRWRVAGVVCAAIGMVCDISGESVYLSLLVERATLGDLAGVIDAQRLGGLLTAGAANALYTIGGVILMRQTSDLPRRVGTAMWATWIAGALMTVSAVFEFTAGLVVSTAVLFPLFLVWTAWMALFWRRP